MVASPHEGAGRAMIRLERDRIAGILEGDETYLGGVKEGRGGGRRRDSSKSVGSLLVMSG